MFKDAAVMVKLIHVPSMMVWFPGIVSVGGISVCTLTVMIAEILACGKAESVTVKSTV